MQVVIVTGLSGAGKSTALRALEDTEYYCVDNIPLPLVDGLVARLAKEGEFTKVAIAIDGRQRRYLADWELALDRLRTHGHRLDIMFLEASDAALLRRFSETRRRHPLSGEDLPHGVKLDRELTTALRLGAIVVDTSNLNAHQLKAIIQDHFGGNGKLAVTFVSFGFKYGLPVDFNLVFDVRFLPNPYFEAELTARDGRDAAVAKFVLGSPQSTELVNHLEGLLRFSLPEFQREGKLYVTMAIGCTGGRHRSVAIVEELKRRLGGEWDILLRHRDVDRGE